MNESKLIENQWVDIIPLTPPESPLFFWIGVGVLLWLVITMVLLYFWWHRPIPASCRKVRKLLHNSNTINNKTRLQQLEKILCQKFNASQLQFIPRSDQAWLNYRRQLLAACYSSEEPAPGITDRLLSGSFIYLKDKGLE